MRLVLISNGKSLKLVVNIFRVSISLGVLFIGLGKSKLLFVI